MKMKMKKFFLHLPPNQLGRWFLSLVHYNFFKLSDGNLFLISFGDVFSIDSAHNRAEIVSNNYQFSNIRRRTIHSLPAAE